MSWSVNHLAGQTVALYGGGTLQDRRELLEMLGIVNSGDTVINADDTRLIEVERVDSMVTERRLVTILEPNGDRSNVPPGLRDLPGAPSRVNHGRPKGIPAPCGSMGGYAAHQRRKEPVCRACKDEYNAQSRERRRLAREAAPPPPSEMAGPIRESCGSLAGRAHHLRRHEKLCRLCGDHYNTHQRAVRARRQQKSSGGPPVDQARSA